MHKIPYKAPNFELQDETGKVFTLDSFAGEWLVLYFYPADDTPGCTIEACSLRDARDDIAALGAKIVGVSKDDAGAHEKFKSKYSLNFTLLTDPNKTAISAYGAWGKKQFGMEGTLRKTFIINPDGEVVKIYGRVVPLGHGEQIIQELNKQQAAYSA